MSFVVPYSTVEIIDFVDIILSISRHLHTFTNTGKKDTVVFKTMALIYVI